MSILKSIQIGLNVLSFSVYTLCFRMLMISFPSCRKSEGWRQTLRGLSKTFYFFTDLCLKYIYSLIFMFLVCFIPNASYCLNCTAGVNGQLWCIMCVKIVSILTVQLLWMIRSLVRCGGRKCTFISILCIHQWREIYFPYFWFICDGLNGRIKSHMSR